MKILCINCNQRLEIPEELAGQTIECPACNARLDVPSPESSPPSSPQVLNNLTANSKINYSLNVFNVALICITTVLIYFTYVFSRECESQRDLIQNALPKHNELETEYANLDSVREQLWKESEK